MSLIFQCVCIGFQVLYLLSLGAHWKQVLLTILFTIAFGVSNVRNG